MKDVLNGRCYSGDDFQSCVMTFWSFLEAIFWNVSKITSLGEWLYYFIFPNKYQRQGQYLLSLSHTKGVKMVTTTESNTKETETEKKGININEKVKKLGNDIDTLAKKTGDEASKLAKSINEEIKALPGELSIDVKNEVKKITGRVEKLVGATDDSAKKLTIEIKTDIKNLVDKIESSTSKKK